MTQQSLGVLNVDPGERDAQKLQHLLKRIKEWDVEFRYAKEIPESMKITAESDVDLVFTEHNLPQSSGLSLLNRLRGSGYHRPVILLTGEGSESLAGRWIRGGGDDYIPKKDLSIEVVHRSVDAVLNRLDVVKKLERENERLRGKTYTDPLTGLFNRRYLSKRLKEESNRAKRYDSRMVVMMVDLDDFKRVNDELGHTMGDEVLKVTAEILQEETRESDTVVRYGGDEFCILLPETERRDSKIVSRRIQGRLRQKSRQLDLENLGTLSCSIGIADGKLGTKDPGDLIERADQKLYKVKQEGDFEALSNLRETQ